MAVQRVVSSEVMRATCWKLMGQMMLPPYHTPPLVGCGKGRVQSGAFRQVGVHVHTYRMHACAITISCITHPASSWGADRSSCFRPMELSGGRYGGVALGKSLRHATALHVRKHGGRCLA